MSTRETRNTFNGKISRLYSGMKRRIIGKGCKSPYLYLGLSICSKEDFYAFAKSNEAFKDLYNKWKADNWNIRLAPSINRINASLGYELSNIEFVPFYINCALSAPTRKKKYDKLSA